MVSHTSSTRPTSYIRYSWVDLLLVTAVGFGLANAAVADFLARGPASLGLSDLASTSIAWALINLTQLLVGCAVVYRRCGSLGRPLMLTRPRPSQVGAGAAWGLASAVVTSVLVVLLPAAITEDGGAEGGYPPGPLLAQLVFAVTFGAIVSPLYEEVLYRGVLFAGLAARMPAFAAIAISASIFAVAHLPRILNTITALLTGLLFAWLLHRYRNLWVPITAHAVANASLTLAAFAVVSSS